MIDLIWVLTALATIILHGSSIPAFIKNYKTKSTKDISITQWLMVLVGYILLLIIAILTNNKYFIIINLIGMLNVGGLVCQVVYYRLK